ncbi:MAG: hypothetical protein ACOX19_00825 [Fermentimonas sp.]
MKRIRFSVFCFIVILLPLFYCSCTKNDATYKGNLKIGWASESITPDSPVHIRGMGGVRISEGIMDSITVTALALESIDDQTSEPVILISCDLVTITDGMRDGCKDNLRDNVRKLITESLPNLKNEQIIMNATHTHTAPGNGPEDNWESVYGIDLDIMSPSMVQKFLADRISKAAIRAWESRKTGGISYGLSHAVVGHNRQVAKISGKSVQYSGTSDPDFSHIEGYEDHSVNLLYTWDDKKNLTGVVINLACPSQVTETFFTISADFWHDTRLELHKRLGKGIYILPQCSSAGDQSPYVMIGAKAEERMQQIMFPDIDQTGNRTIGRRKQIAMRISDAVLSILPYMKEHVEWNPVFIHRTRTVELSGRLFNTEYVFYHNKINAIEAAKESERQYQEMLDEINNNPEIKNKPRWYVSISRFYQEMKNQQKIIERSKMQQDQPRVPIEIHVIRIGDMVIATNPFELYLDYGIRIKGRSPAVQTFIVQLTGDGLYLPTFRSEAGGSYGAGQRVSLIGPEGGAGTRGTYFGTYQ